MWRTWSSWGGFFASTGVMRLKRLSFGTSSTRPYLKRCPPNKHLELFASFCTFPSIWTKRWSNLCPKAPRRWTLSSITNASLRTARNSSSNLPINLEVKLRESRSPVLRKSSKAMTSEWLLREIRNSMASFDSHGQYRNCHVLVIKQKNWNLLHLHYFIIFTHNQ